MTSGHYDLVFGGGDDWMAALSAYRPQVPAAVAHPDFAAVRAGLDKVTLGDVAAQVGLAAPHTEPATEDNLARWTGPLVLKSRSHWTPGARHVQRIDARLFATPAEATERIELIVASGGEAVMQRPVHGQLGALIGVFHEGRLRGRVQQTTARLWPSPSGMSSRAQTVPVDAVLCARAEDLLGRIGWRGLVELQFLTGDDGVPHLIDLNGRFYGSLALADAACPGLGRPGPGRRSACRCRTFPTGGPVCAMPGGPVTCAGPASSGGAAWSVTSRALCVGGWARGTACGRRGTSAPRGASCASARVRSTCRSRVARLGPGSSGSPWSAGPDGSVAARPGRVRRRSGWAVGRHHRAVCRALTSVRTALSCAHPRAHRPVVRPNMRSDSPRHRTAR